MSNRRGVAPAAAETRRRRGFIRAEGSIGTALTYIFEWDSGKAAENAQKHGVTFDEASTVFGDPLALLMPDPDHSEGEERYLLLGMSTRRQLLVVGFAEPAQGPG